MSRDVKKFMQLANRPYSVTDVVQALKDISKGVVQKNLDSLVVEGSLMVKEYGKQKIYCAVQRDVAGSDEDLTDIDSEIQNSKTELNRLKLELNKVEAKMKSLNSSKTTEQLNVENNQLKEDINDLQIKLMRFKKKENTLTNSQMDEVGKKWDSYVKIYSKRKRVANDILDQILESYPKTKKHLYEDIGIEDDESVKMPKLSV